MKRGRCKPVYLQGRLHFDLSQDDRYDDEYIRLIKTLYGESVYPKPSLGSKPVWVEKQEVVDVKKRNTYESLKTINPEKARKRVYSEYAEGTLKGVTQILAINHSFGGYKDAISFYEEFRNIRTEYLILLEYSIYVDESEQIVSSQR